jgi:hypothetical protein
MTNLMYLDDTIQYTIHDTIQNVTIHDTNYDSTSMKEPHLFSDQFDFARWLIVLLCKSGH